MRDRQQAALLMFWLLPGTVVWGGLGALYIALSLLNFLAQHQQPNLLVGICAICLYGLSELWLRLFTPNRIRPFSALRKTCVLMSYGASILMLSLPSSMLFQMVLNPQDEPIARLAAAMAILVTVMPLALIGSGMVYEMFQQPSFHYRRRVLTHKKAHPKA